MADPILPQPGIYAIRHIATGRAYIGSAINVNQRIIMHRSRLTHDSHPSSHLQRAWNKYGVGAFAFEVLEYMLDVGLLLEREQHWIDELETYTRARGFNARRVATSNLGLSPSKQARQRQRDKMLIYWSAPGRREAEAERVRGRKMSAEAIAKSANSRRGKKLSAQHRANLSKAHTGVPLSATHRAAIGAGGPKTRSAAFKAAVSAGIRKHWIIRRARRQLSAGCASTQAP